LISDPREDTIVVGTINNISFTLPTFPLLTQPEEVNDSVFCDENKVPKNCIGSSVCECVHRLKVKKDAIVELVVVDESICKLRIFTISNTI
jgi:hypothetical protein